MTAGKPDVRITAARTEKFAPSHFKTVAASRALAGQGQAGKFEIGVFGKGAFRKELEAGLQRFFFHAGHKAKLAAYLFYPRFLPLTLPVVFFKLVQGHLQKAPDKAGLMQAQRSVQETQGSMLLVISATSATSQLRIITPRASQFM